MRLVFVCTSLFTPLVLARGLRQRPFLECAPARQAGRNPLFVLACVPALLPINATMLPICASVIPPSRNAVSDWRNGGETEVNQGFARSRNAALRLPELRTGIISVRANYEPAPTGTASQVGILQEPECRCMKSLADLLGTLDPGSNQPLYQQLQRGLREAIERRILGPEDALPSERQLATELGVSRITVRKAIDGLAAEGLLVSRQGSGNFVSARIDKNFAKLT